MGGCCGGGHHNHRNRSQGPRVSEHTEESGNVIWLLGLGLVLVVIGLISVLR